jgi:hypothetical protein
LCKKHFTVLPVSLTLRGCAKALARPLGPCGVEENRKIARVAANPSHEDNGGFLADSAIEAEMKEAIARPEKK